MKFKNPFKPSLRDRLNAEDKYSIPTMFSFKQLLLFGSMFFVLGVASSLMILL